MRVETRFQKEIREANEQRRKRRAKMESDESYAAIIGARYNR